MLSCLAPVLFTFYIQGVLKFKKNSGAKGLKCKQYVISMQVRTQANYNTNVIQKRERVKGKTFRKRLADSFQTYV